MSFATISNFASSQGLPTSYAYLDEQMLLPKLFEYLTPGCERELLRSVLNALNLRIKFPPIDILKIVSPLLDLYSGDEKVTNELLQLVTNQMAYDDQLVKFFISYSAVNIYRNGHQRFILGQFATFMPYFVSAAELSKDAQFLISFLLKRFPVKFWVIQFWKFPF